MVDFLPRVWLEQTHADNLSLVGDREGSGERDNHTLETETALSNHIMILQYMYQWPTLIMHNVLMYQRVHRLSM